MVCAEGLLINCQGMAQECLGFGVSALALKDDRELVE